MNIIKIIKKIGWIIFDNLPFKLRYILMFYKEKKRFPRIKHPKDYCDYIFIDNYYGNHNIHAFLADKYKVRDYVEERGLGFLLTKLLSVWDDAEKIDFNKLPNQFALKCNHSCGMNIICKDKNNIDIEECRDKMREWLKEEHPIFFEQHYFHIKPLIIAEELIECNADGTFPYDYKIHCANGKPIFIQLCYNRTDCSVGFRKIYSTEWEDLHYVVEDYHYSERNIPKPNHLKEMLEYASILSKGLSYARVDFYDTDSRVIFGEITLTPMGGLLTYFKQEALDVMGEEIRKANYN